MPDLLGLKQAREFPVVWDSERNRLKVQELDFDIVPPGTHTPATLKVGYLGGSLFARQHEFHTMAAGTVEKRNGQFFVTYANNWDPSEVFVIRSRNFGWRGPIQRPVSLTSGTAVFNAATPGSLGFNTADLDNSVTIYNLSRMDMHASSLRVAACDPELAGKIEVIGSVAHGGNNHPEMLADIEEILDLARRLRKVNGVLIGSLGSQVAVWTDQRGVSLLKRILETGVVFINQEYITVSTGTATQTNIANLELIRQTMERLSAQYPNLIFMNNLDLSVDKTNVNGLGAATNYVDDVHHTHRYSLTLGAALATILKKFVRPGNRILRAHIGDIWDSSAAVPEGGNLFQGFWPASPLLAVSTLTTGAGTGTKTGNMNSSLRLVQSASLDCTATQVTVGTEQHDQLAFTWTGAIQFEVANVGRNAAPMAQSIRAGMVFDVASKFSLTGITGVQRHDCFVDQGNGTARFGGFSCGSPQYVTDAARAVITQNEDSTFFFPKLLQYAVTPSTARLVHRIETSGTGGCTLTLKSGMFRRVASWLLE